MSAPYRWNWMEQDREVFSAREDFLEEERIAREVWREEPPERGKAVDITLYTGQDDIK